MSRRPKNISMTECLRDGRVSGYHLHLSESFSAANERPNVDHSCRLQLNACNVTHWSSQPSIMQCDQIWQNFAVFAKKLQTSAIWKVSEQLFCKFLRLLWPILMLFAICSLLFTAKYWRIFNSSHCFRDIPRNVSNLSQRLKTLLLQSLSNKQVSGES